MHWANCVVARQHCCNRAALSYSDQKHWAAVLAVLPNARQDPCSVHQRALCPPSTEAPGLPGRLPGSGPDKPSPHRPRSQAPRCDNAPLSQGLPQPRHLAALA